jgi:hypothetical protein
MYPPFTLDLPVPPRPLMVGEPVFVIDKDGWFIRPGCVTAGGPPAPEVHVQYRVPTGVENLFGASAAQSYMSFGTVGIEEPVSCSLVVPMENFAQPAAVGDTLPAGTIVVLLRPEPFRVQLAQLETPVTPDDASADVVSMRLLAPTSAGSSIAAVGASMKAKPSTFVAVARFASGLRESFNPAEPRYFLA